MAADRPHCVCLIAASISKSLQCASARCVVVLFATYLYLFTVREGAKNAAVARHTHIKEGDVIWLSQ